MELMPVRIQIQYLRSCITYDGALSTYTMYFKAVIGADVHRYYGQLFFLAPVQSLAATRFSIYEDLFHELCTSERIPHWNGNVVILMELRSLAALGVVKACWQLPQQPVINISSKCWYFCFSNMVSQIATSCCCSIHMANIINSWCRLNVVEIVIWHF